MSFFKWFRRLRSTARSFRRRNRLPLHLEVLEERTLLSVEPLTLADPSFWGNSGLGVSSAPSISADGQLVVFQSDAPNLVPGDTNGTTDVFLYDRGTGRVSVVSADRTGLQPGNRDSIDPQISPDGRYVVFRSAASNLVDGLDTPIGAGSYNIFLRDLTTGTTQIVSLNNAGDGGGDGNSDDPSISVDSQGVIRIAFESGANDLVPGDTNNAHDIFVRTLPPTGPTSTVRVSVSTAGDQGNRGSTSPSISGDGMFVVFESDADTLTANDNNTGPDIFVRDLTTNTTEIVTADPTNQQSADQGGSTLSRQPISADGRFVVFTSDAGNLVSQTPNFNPNAYVRDTQTHTTRLLSVDRAGTATTDGLNVVVTPNGQFAAFVSRSDNVASDVADTNGSADVILSTITPTTITNRLVSVNAAGSNGGNGNSGMGPFNDPVGIGFPQVSPDGRFVAFASEATDLVAGISDGNDGLGGALRRDVFVRDMQLNVTRVVSLTPGATITGNSGSYSPALSADGRFVAVESDASDLLPAGDRNQRQDVFVRDVTAGTTELASRRSPLLPDEVLALQGGDLRAITPDGRFVAFASDTGFNDHSDLVPGVTVAGSTGLYVRDRQTGGIRVANLLPGSNTIPASNLYKAALSADGRFVAFDTQNAQLDPMLTAVDGGIYVHDLLIGSTRLVSRNTTTNEPANVYLGGVDVTISPDGRYVAFTNGATNLVSGVTVPANQPQLYLHDRQTGTTRLVSINASGTAPGNGNTDITEYEPAFNGDGSKLVFLSRSSDLVASVTDANDDLDVFVLDLATGTTTLASVSTTPSTAADRGSAEAALSADGRYVVFTSAATDLAPGDTSGVAQVYRRDLTNNQTARVSADDAGTPGDSTSRHPSVSDNGSQVLFESFATNLTSLDSQGVLQVYVHDFTANTTRMVSGNASGTAGGDDTSGTVGGISPALTADGRYAAFFSYAGDLVSGFVDGNGSAPDLYLRDLALGATVLVTVNNSGTASAGPNPVLAGFNFRLAADTPTVVFDSTAVNLVHNADNEGGLGSTDDVFAFDFAGAGSIRGTVFNDADGNGTQGGSEAGIPYWTVFLDANGNRRFDDGEINVPTDLSGNYRFSNLPAGNYRVAVVIDAGYVQTTVPLIRNVTLATATSASTGNDFGARRTPADLVVDHVTALTAAQPGDNVAVSWVVHNVGTGAITTGWQDAVYLSTDATLDASDTLLATVPHSGTLAWDGTYTGAASVKLPGVLPGNYFVIVQADRRYQVPNETNRTNNILAADAPTALTVPALTLGTPAAGQFTAAGQDHYYQVIVPQGQTVRVTLDSAATAGTTEVYVSRLHLPNVADHDFAGLAIQPDQTVTVPTTGPGTYYVLVRSRTGAATTATFTVTAATVNLGMQSVSPNVGGNTGRATVEVHGTRLTATTQVSLVSGGTTIPAAAIDFRDASLLYATFDLTGRAVGAYDLRATDGAATATLPGAFTVVPGQAEPLQINLAVAPNIRPGHIGRALVEYTNTGNTDVPAPFLEFAATKSAVRLDEERDFHGDPHVGGSVQFLGIASDGPAGVLRPGQSGRVRVLFLTTDEDETDVQLSVNVLDTTATIDWASMEDGLRPGYIPADAWDALYPNLLTEVGATDGDYQNLLDRDASYLSSIGVYTADAMRLFGYEIAKADAGFTAGTLARMTDASFPTPGSSLVFAREPLQSIHGRYMVGPFGRGWTHNWDMEAITLASDDVVVRFGAARRFFAHQQDGSYRGEAGDYAALTLTNGKYTLTESQNAVWQFRTDGKLDFVGEHNGHRVTAGYDGSGRLISLTHSAGRVISLRYNAQGRIDLLTDPAGRTVSYAYDSSGEHLTSYTDKFGTNTYTYVTGQGAQREHALASVNFSDDTHIEYTYDSRGRLIHENRDGGAEPTTYAYLSAGGFTLTDVGGNVTTVLQDDLGQVRRVTDPLGRVTDYGYDVNQNPVGVTLQQSVAFSYAFDAQGNLTRITDAVGNLTSFTYDDHDNLTTFTDARGNTTRYAFDAKDNLRSEINSAGEAKLFTYDERGLVSTSTNRRGRVIGYQYNADGQLLRKDFADGSFAEYSYDGFGRLTTARDTNGTVTLGYNDNDTLRKITYPDGKSLAFEYNAGGQRTRSVDQDGFTTNYVYDDLGRLGHLTDGAGALIVRYAYDMNGRLSREDKGNGTATTYEYDAAGQLLRLRHLKPDGSVNSFFDYEYDALGRRTMVSTADGVTRYEYDALGQLTKVTLPGGRTIEYRYDAAGNRTRVIDSQLGTTNFVANELNQYTRAGSTSYIYDLDGNLLSKTDAAGSTAYTFDDENRLIGINGPDLTAVYTYDPLGHRNSATVQGQTTSYLIDPVSLWSATAEYTGGSLTAHYIQGLGLISRVGASGSAGYYDFDAAGNTVGLTDAAGAYINRYFYMPFGETTAAAAALPNPFTFVGRFGVMDYGGGLFDMRFRKYDPAIGRFISEDPLGIGAGDQNTLRYVSNDPINLSDPLGLQAGWQRVRCSVYGTSLPLQDADTPGWLAAELDWSHSHWFRYDDAGRIVDNTGFGSFYRSYTPEELKNLTYEPYGPRITDPLFDIILKQRRQHYDKQPGFSIFLPGTNCHHEANELEREYLRARLSLIKSKENLVHQLRANDPNDLVGPGGFGTAHFVRADQTLPYTIHFENEKSATAPAQEVFITQQLAGTLDLSSFAMGDIGFGSVTIDVPDGLQAYQTRIAYQNLQNGGTRLLVDVSAALNAQTGIVTWTFRSVDPVTGQLPEEVLDGFLPPNDDTRRGEGFVSYTVRAKPGLATGTQVRGVANVVFDTNAAIATNQVDPHDPSQGTDPNKEALVTIDSDAPASSVAILPSFRPTTFTVSWSGTDQGSGIANYDVFVSDNGAPFTQLLTGTILTATSFTGVHNHTYRFYSVATDNVGHRQPTTATAQATTKVDSVAPTSTVAALPPFRPATFTVSWSGSDGAGESGLATFDVFVSDNGGPFSALVTGTTQSSTSFTGVNGHTYGFYSVATDNVGNRQATPAAARASTRVDAVAPTSSVAALPAFTGATTFTLSWSGADNVGGSGLATFDVFVSDNGAPFTALLTATTQTSTSFTGLGGHTYGFYSVAVDNAGNREATPNGAQATTTVDSTPPTSSVSSLPAFRSATFTVAWSGTDSVNGSGIASYDVFVSDNGGPFTAFQTATMQTSASFTGVNGHTYGFYSVAVDNVGNRQPTPSAAQATTTVDSLAPTSTVAPLPIAVATTTFTVSWSGSDNAGGSGLAVYDVYVSDNGGSFMPFQTGTVQTSASFTGQNGHTYGFSSVATDNVGNRQPTPAAAQGTTQVDTLPPSGGIQPLAAVQSSTSFTVSWSGSDGPGGSGIASWNVFLSQDGGPATLLLDHTTATSTVFTGADGHTYSFSVAAIDRAGNVQTDLQPAVTRVQLPQPLRPLRAVLVNKKQGSKRVLFVRILFADTGEIKREFRSPFQKPGYTNISVTIKDSDGDGRADSVVVSGRRGHKSFTRNVAF
jgi:RHS repeat-associated protein